MTVERQQELGDAIAWLRLRVGLAQREVAADADCSRVFLQKIESGERFPSAETLDAILAALDASRLELEGLLQARPWADAPNWEREPRRRAATVLAYERSRGKGTWSDPVKKPRRRRR